jgi:hypothetical protein
LLGGVTPAVPDLAQKTLWLSLFHLKLFLPQVALVLPEPIPRIHVSVRGEALSKLSVMISCQPVAKSFVTADSWDWATTGA